MTKSSLLTELPPNDISFVKIDGFVSTTSRGLIPSSRNCWMTAVREVPSIVPRFSFPCLVLPTYFNGSIRDHLLGLRAVQLVFDRFSLAERAHSSTFQSYASLTPYSSVRRYQFGRLFRYELS